MKPGLGLAVLRLLLCFPVGSDAVVVLPLRGVSAVPLAVVGSGDDRRHESAAVVQPTDNPTSEPRPTRTTSRRPKPTMQPARTSTQKLQKFDDSEETEIHSHIPFSLEMLIAFMYCGLVASVPLVLRCLFPGGNLTTIHKIESTALVVWFVSVTYLFCNVAKFESGSGHFKGQRSLTIVEAVYLLSQILTTVGYGDITPADWFCQVWVALNVIIALCMYGSCIMECLTRIAERVKAHIAERARRWCDQQEAMESARGVPLKHWQEKRPHVSTGAVTTHVSCFLLAVLVGMCFFHFYPGEDKTWVQAAYMSMITLSTVGFGDLVAVTEAGKVFAAFWMVLGVISLAASFASFFEYLNRWKALQRRTPEVEHSRFFKLIQKYSIKKDKTSPHDRGVDRGMTFDEFLKFALVLKGVVTIEEFEHIQARFKTLAGEGKEVVDAIVVFNAEAPPIALMMTARAQATYREKFWNMWLGGKECWGCCSFGKEATGPMDGWETASERDF